MRSLEWDYVSTPVCTNRFLYRATGANIERVVCRSLQALRGVSLEDCRRRACDLEADTFAYRNRECQLKDCSAGFRYYEGSEGWDMYTLASVEVTTSDGPGKCCLLCLLSWCMGDTQKNDTLRV